MSEDEEENEDVDNPAGKGKEKDGKKDAMDCEEEEEEEEKRNRQGVEIRVEQNKEQAKTGEAETGQKGNDTLDKAQELLEKSRRVLQEEGDEADENSEDEDVRERLFNLWTTMDPHSNQGIRPAPFKKGKTYRIPASLEQSDTKNGKGRSKKGILCQCYFHRASTQSIRSPPGVSRTRSSS